MQIKQYDDICIVLLKQNIFLKIYRTPYKDVKWWLNLRPLLKMLEEPNYWKQFDKVE